METTIPSRRVPGWGRVVSLGLSLTAVAIASYLTVAHYTDPAALACPDTGIVNCALVTTSSWSVVLGVPLALLGLVWAVAMTALHRPLVLGLERRLGRPRAAPAVGRGCGCGALPRLRGALPHRGGLPVVHGHARHRRLSLRGDPGGPGEHSGGGSRASLTSAAWGSRRSPVETGVLSFSLRRSRRERARAGDPYARGGPERARRHQPEPEPEPKRSRSGCAPGGRAGAPRHAVRLPA